MFVQRENGKIVGLFELPQPGYAEEEIAADHPDVIAFQEPRISSISCPQMIMALRFLDKITESEAVDAMTIGAVPAAVQAVFDTMSPMNKFTATIRWAGASVIERDNPIVLALAASDGMSETELDDFFRFAVTL